MGTRSVVRRAACFRFLERVGHGDLLGNGNTCHGRSGRTSKAARSLWDDLHATGPAYRIRGAYSFAISRHFRLPLGKGVRRLYVPPWLC